MFFRTTAIVGLIGGMEILAPAGLRPALAEEIDKNRGGFDHVVTAKTEYYTTHPAQGRRSDGALLRGTKVRALRNSGSYVEVVSDTGITAFVSRRALRPVDARTNAARQPGAESISDAEVAAVRGGNRFAMELYAGLGRDSSDSLFFSPYSIWTALTMTLAGAAGETRVQMTRTLYCDLPEADLHTAVDRLRRRIQAGNGGGADLRIANRLWGAKQYRVLPEFQEVVRTRYDAELGRLDFASDAEGARQEINRWVELRTAERIKDLLTSGMIDADTRLVLANAVYFKGGWREKFSKDATRDASFFVSARRSVKTPLMCRAGQFRYCANDDLQILEIPYAAGNLSMTVLLPRQRDGLATLEASLDEKKLREWVGSLSPREVRVYLPRFTLTPRLRLTKTLAEMGMSLPFGENADFSRIAKGESLQLSEVVHQAFVLIHEEGTEAAAATAVIAVPTSAIGGADATPTFRADHPFVFLIRESRSGAILFLGRIVNPAQ